MKTNRGTLLLMEHARLERLELRRKSQMLQQIIALAYNNTVTDEAFRDYVQSLRKGEVKAYDMESC